ncbi:MAG: hypothetical protein D6732_11430 [Methanobacteriota archaeon]|nr:MAG: hypothetical protein D6732_11430 [Euryarchaeota archaeon]
MFDDEETLQRLAQTGNPLAIFNLGRKRLQEGKKEEARKYFEQAAARGHLGGMFKLGEVSLELGDKETAKTWLQKAAERGHKKAAELLKDL